MRLRTALASITALALPCAAFAQPVAGLYVGAGAGVNVMPTQNDGVTSSYGALPGITTGVFGKTFVGTDTVRSSAGVAAVGSVGYGLGNGLRVEAEGSYRYNLQNMNGNHFGGAPNREQTFGGMANLLFDFDTGLPYLYPYLGAGIGYMHTDRALNLPSSGAFAYQGIVGLAMPIAYVPGLSATLEYRFLGLDTVTRTSVNTGATYDTATNTVLPVTQTLKYKFPDDYNHSILLGLRYAFDTPAPPPPVAASVPAPAVAQPSRTYLVFFDWDSSELTDRARQIVVEAAQARTRVQTTRIEVQGNADRSGTPAYNQHLSLRRAQTVAAELVRNGVPQSEIDIQAFGDTRPLVPTAAGVREPQNRRVAIVLR